MNAITKESFFKLAENLKVEDVPVPEMGEGAFVRVRELTGSDRDAIEAMSSLRSDGSMEFVGFRARVLSRSIIDKNGNLIFGPEDVDKLGQVPSAVVVRLFAAVSKMSGLSKESADTIEKNSDAQSQKE